MSNRILFTASTYSHIRSFHLPYLRAFQADGWEVHIACGGPIPPECGADRSFSVPFEKRMSSPANFRAQRMLRDLMKAQQYRLARDRAARHGHRPRGRPPRPSVGHSSSTAAVASRQLA